MVTLAAPTPEERALNLGCGSGTLLARLHARRRVGVDLSPRQIAAARQRVPAAEFHVQAGEALDLAERFDCIVISDTLNFAADVQLLLARLHRVAHRDTRLIINYHSLLWRPLHRLAQLAGLRSPQPESSWTPISAKAILENFMVVPIGLWNCSDAVDISTQEHCLARHAGSDVDFSKDIGAATTITNIGK